MASKIHAGKCGPCKKESTKYAHLNKIDPKASELICQLEQLDQQCEACICHACYKQVQRNLENPDYHPRWRDKTQSIDICSIENCNESAYRHTAIASPQNIELLVGKKLVSLPSTSSEQVRTSLCQQHYTLVHTSIHTRQPCESCGCKPKWSEKEYFRHCSSPEVINSYMSMISGEVSELTASSTICMSCYRLFNAISSGKVRRRFW